MMQEGTNRKRKNGRIHFVRKVSLRHIAWKRSIQSSCGETIHVEFLKLILYFHNELHYDPNKFSVLLIQKELSHCFLVLGSFIKIF